MTETENMLTQKVLDHEDRIKALEDKMATMTVSTDGTIPTNVVTQDAGGNVILTGVFQAKTVQAQTGSFAGALAADTVQAKVLGAESLKLGDQTSGTATMKAGQTEITISSTEAKSDSKIYITPTGKLSGRSLYVNMKKVVGGESFTVDLDGDPLDADVDFNWMVVN